MSASANADRLGLSSQVLGHLVHVFSGFPEIQQVMVYGSRGRGEHDHYSDIDLAITAPGISDSRKAECAWKIEDLPIIFSIDMVWMSEIDSGAPIAKNIARDGVAIYPS